MPTRVLLTVDTELLWRHHAAGLDWRENFARSYDAAGVGVPFQLGVLQRHGLNACFFVDPMPALVFGLEPIQRMVEPILAAGQEVQLHLHPFWSALARDAEDEAEFELTGLPFERQLELIEQAKDLLIRSGAPKPIAFRAGSYAVDAVSLEALRRAGLRYDSSHNGCEHPWPSALPLPRAQIAPIEADGVTEIPVTQIAPGEGRLRHLQICAVSLREMTDALLHARTASNPAVTIVSHSFELATRDGLRVKGIARDRFLGLCRWLEAHRQTHPTAHFTDLDGIALGVPARPMPVPALRTARRVAEQVWGDTRYEKPADALTAVYGTGVSGLEAIIPYVL